MSGQPPTGTSAYIKADQSPGFMRARRNGFDNLYYEFAGSVRVPVARRFELRTIYCASIWARVLGLWECRHWECLSILVAAKGFGADIMRTKVCRVGQRAKYCNQIWNTIVPAP